MTAVPHYRKGSAAALVSALACGSCPECSMATRQGQGVVHCPAHDDRYPSLSVRDRDSKTLVHCFSGCGQTDVLAALTNLGLWRSRR